MSSTSDRKLELERKRQRLAEIRAEKARAEAERRRSALPNRDASDSSSSAPQPPTNETVEEILHNIDLPAPTSAVAAVVPPPIFNTSPARPKALQVSQMVQVDFDTKSNNVHYVKATQTEEGLGIGGAREFHGGSLDNDFWEEEIVNHGRGSQSDMEGFTADESPTHQLAALLPGFTLHKQSVPAVDTVPVIKRGPEMNEAQKQEILTSTEFMDFFERQSRVLERALDEKPVDIFADYASTIDDTDKRRFDDDADILVLNRKFFLDRLDLTSRLHRSLKGRSVASIDQSTMYPELIAVGYTDSMSPDANDANKDGVVCVWNTKFKKDTPEYVFFSPSPVTSVAFAKYNPNLLLAGTYSGRICLWNNREHKNTPVQRSPLSTSSHTHPVYSASVQGTANANNLITVSADGKMCAWNVEMLQEPQETIDLAWNVTKTAALAAGTPATKGYEKQVPVTCLSFPVNSVNNFVVGSEDGYVYAGQRHGQRAGITSIYIGHSALVTGIDFHRAAGAIDFSHLFLTSSCDWTVKLWSTKETKPLHSFDMFNNYVVDVQWCPTNPSVFACIDAAGTIQIYNIAIDTDTPLCSMHVEGDEATIDTPLNRLRWACNSGPDGTTQLLVGTQNGTLYVFDVNTHLCTPDQQEWERLSETLGDLARQQDDRVEEAQDEERANPPIQPQSSIGAGMPMVQA